MTELTEKITSCWKNLDRKIMVNQRELVLGVAACALAGVVVGIFLSPRKNVTIGSHNASNNQGNNATLPADIQVNAEDEEEVKE